MWQRVVSRLFVVVYATYGTTDKVDKRTIDNWCKSGRTTFPKKPENEPKESGYLIRHCTVVPETFGRVT